MQSDDPHGNKVIVYSYKHEGPLDKKFMVFVTHCPMKKMVNVDNHYSETKFWRLLLSK